MYPVHPFEELLCTNTARVLPQQTRLAYSTRPEPFNMVTEAVCFRGRSVRYDLLCNFLLLARSRSLQAPYLLQVVRLDLVAKKSCHDTHLPPDILSPSIFVVSPDRLPGSTSRNMSRLARVVLFVASSSVLSPSSTAGGFLHPRTGGRTGADSFDSGFAMARDPQVRASYHRHVTLTDTFTISSIVV